MVVFEVFIGFVFILTVILFALMFDKFIQTRLAKDMGELFLILLLFGLTITFLWVVGRVIVLFTNYFFLV